MSQKEIAEKFIEELNPPVIIIPMTTKEISEKSYLLARAYLELEEKHEYVHNKLLDDIEYQKSEITKLKKSREVLRKACEFYASSDQWNCTKEQLTTYNTIDKDDLGIGDFQFTCDVDDDRVGGKKAREALKTDNEIMEGK